MGVLPQMVCPPGLLRTQRPGSASSSHPLQRTRRRHKKLLGRHTQRGHKRHHSLAIFQHHREMPDTATECDKLGLKDPDPSARHWGGDWPQEELPKCTSTPRRHGLIVAGRGTNKQTRQHAQSSQRGCGRRGSRDGCEQQAPHKRFASSHAVRLHVHCQRERRV